MTGPQNMAPLATLRPWIVRYVRRRRVEASDVQDMTQEVLLHAILGWRSFAPSGASNALRRWVAGIARNRVAMYHRARRARSRLEGPDVETSVPGHEGRIEARSTLARLRAFTTHERWATLLAALGERRTAREIATHEGIPRSTVEWRLRKALADVGAPPRGEKRPPRLRDRQPYRRALSALGALRRARRIEHAGEDPASERKPPSDEG